MRHFMAITDAFFFEEYWRGDYCGNCEAFHSDKVLYYDKLWEFIRDNWWELFTIYFMVKTDEMKYDDKRWEVL